MQTPLPTEAAHANALAHYLTRRLGMAAPAPMAPPFLTTLKIVDTMLSRLELVESIVEKRREPR